MHTAAAVLPLIVFRPVRTNMQELTPMQVNKFNCLVHFATVFALSFLPQRSRQIQGVSRVQEAKLLLYGRGLQVENPAA